MTGNTAQSFRDKWEKNIQAFYGETLRSGSDTQSWILKRNGFSAADEFISHLSDRRRILDAGCGNGRVTALLRTLAPEEAEIVGIDLVAADVARENFKDVPRTHFETRDLTTNLSSLGQFDFIYCQEVLHHTADPVRSFNNLRELLSPNGELAIYVYKEKAPAREFVDDYVRDQIALLPYTEAMAHSAQITDFGRALAEANLKVKVPQVDVLGIEAGEYDVQRLLYHFFAKCYWNPDVSYEENVLVNYDWYHPQVATRHTLKEVETWFDQARLKIEHRCVDFYGITIRGRNV
jgi:SAM-dependent methyltransferase